MTAPNLKSPTQVTGKTYSAPLTSEGGWLIGNYPDSGQVFKINSIVVRSHAAETPFTLTLYLMQFGTLIYSFMYQRTIDPLTVIEVVNRNTAFYLEEGVSIQHNASENFMADVQISYEVIGEPDPPEEE
jgi:hypothetical protein